MKSCIMEALVISAPKLEELYFTSHNDYDIDVDGELLRVWSLKAKLCSHGDHDDDDINDSTIRLLHHCSQSVRRLEMSLHVSQSQCQELDFFCQHMYHNKSQEISLPHLQDVEFKILIGTDCELCFMQSVLSSATILQEVDRYKFLPITLTRASEQEG
ncbi:unnamed protein product [Urochloa humidicola]